MNKKKNTYQKPEMVSFTFTLPDVLSASQPDVPDVPTTTTKKGGVLLPIDPFN